MTIAVDWDVKNQTKNLNTGGIPEVIFSKKSADDVKSMLKEKFDCSLEVLV